MKNNEILEIITIATELKKINNNVFFLIKGMITERNLNKKNH